MLSGGAGTEERAFGSARLGGKVGEKWSYRVYAKYFDRDESVNAQGDATADDWRMSRAGFRTDWKLSHGDDFTFQGDIYDGETGQQAEFSTLNPPFTETVKGDAQLSGGNLLARWQHTFSETSDMTLQFYYDRTEREQLIGTQDRDTLDMDLQHRFAWGSFQEIIWGLGYRYTHDDISPELPLDIKPHSQDDHLFSAFIQDEITVLENRLRLILGSKFEHNDYTGFEIQPSGRIVWTPHKDHTLWSAVSRAVRTPSRQENDVEFIAAVIPPGVPENPGPLPAAVTVFGNDDLESEELVALELGYRVQASDRLSFDLAAFYNIYDNLVTTTVPDTPFLRMSPPPPYVVIPQNFANKMDGETYGLEGAAEWRPLNWWQLHLAYTLIKMDLDVEDGAIDPENEGDNPEQQVSVRSSMDLPWDLELDLWLRYVDSLSEPRVPSYTTLDVRLGWQPLENLEFSIAGQNLLDSQHAEFIDKQLMSAPTEVERSFYGKVTLRF